MIETSSSGTSQFTQTFLSSASDRVSTLSDRNFEEIITDYWSNEQRGSALDYLNSLTGSELRTVGREHGFADPTPNLYGINIEGANNLLRHRGETIDENRDGIDQIGEARTWRFPNSNTPENVRAAWEEASEGMEDVESMLMAGLLYLPLPQVVQDELTGATTIISPGEPGYKNPAQQPGYSYSQIVENKLRALDDPSNPPSDIEHYHKAKAFYQKLLESYEAHGVS